MRGIDSFFLEQCPINKIGRLGGVVKFSHVLNPGPSVATAMRSTIGQFDLPGIQIIEPTLENYLSPDKMTFFPFLGYIYTNCKNTVNAFPENTDPTNLKYDDLTKAAALIKPDKSENSKKVVCSYPITTM